MTIFGVGKIKDGISVGLTFFSMNLATCGCCGSLVYVWGDFPGLVSTNERTLKRDSL